MHREIKLTRCRVAKVELESGSELQPNWQTASPVLADLCERDYRKLQNRVGWIRGEFAYVFTDLRLPDDEKSSPRGGSSTPAYKIYGTKTPTHGYRKQYRLEFDE